MVKINVCCGPRNFGPDWIHVDGGMFTHLNSMDIHLRTTDTDSVDLVYCSHGIAYFSAGELAILLAAWFRVLKPGGILRLATPNWDALRLMEVPMLGPLYGQMELNGQLIYHKMVYGATQLAAVLEQAGFIAPRLWDWRTTEHAIHDDHSQAYANPNGDKENGVLISLNMEATKP